MQSTQQTSAPTRVQEKESCQLDAANLHLSPALAKVITIPGVCGEAAKVVDATVRAAI